MTDLDLVIGIDPDSKAHGMAVYTNGKLTCMHPSTLVSIIHFIEFYTSQDWKIRFAIENVTANNAVFRTGHNKKVQQSIARRLGMVQQAQTELERIIESYGIPITHFKISKRWKKEKAEFEKVTGWTGRSNEDTRSAAYFGWLLVTQGSSYNKIK